MSTFLDAHAHTRIDSPETGVLETSNEFQTSPRDNEQE